MLENILDNIHTYMYVYIIYTYTYYLKYQNNNRKVDLKGNPFIATFRQRFKDM